MTVFDAPFGYQVDFHQKRGHLRKNRAVITEKKSHDTLSMIIRQSIIDRYKRNSPDNRESG